MDLYQQSQFKMPRIGKIKKKSLRIFYIGVSVVLLSSFFGFLSGILSGSYFYLEIKDYLSQLNIELPGVTALNKEYTPQTSQEEAIVRAVERVSPAVVSIVITKDIPIFEEYYVYPFQGSDLFIPQYRQKGTQKQEIGGGTGFLVSEDGMVLTNKHVVLDEEAEYTVFTNDGKNYSAVVLARDSFQDLAVLRIDRDKIVDDEGNVIIKSFPTVTLGDSDGIKIGQTVIAIGNALGEFRNTISVGVVSGLGRTITASGGDFVETIEDVIQTDAAINKGNSGGPLLNLRGEVIGINTAMVQDAQSIGFAITINKAKRDIEQVKRESRIVYPFLGIRYIVLTDILQKDNDLPVNYGAWLIKGDAGEPAVESGSAAAATDLKESDIILEFNGERITINNPLTKIIQKYFPNDTVTLKVLQDGEEKVFSVTLGER